MKLQAVLFDVSGTVLDFGSRAPAQAMVELFRRHGVALSEAEARQPMGANKRDHIAALLDNPAIRARWQQPAVALDALYAEFTALQIELLPLHVDLIPGVLELLATLRRRGLKIANNTGYSRLMMQTLIPLAEAAGYVPDCWVTPDDVGAGRPAPWMAFHAARLLNVYPMSTFVKVGDTPVDIAEAHAAGMWSVAVVHHGNEVGLAREQLASLTPAEQQALFEAARKRLEGARPHFIVDEIRALPAVFDEIDARLAAGQRP
jgi:phosphonoacetaldehyde hydrolase